MTLYIVCWHLSFALFFPHWYYVRCRSLSPTTFHTVRTVYVLVCLHFVKFLTFQLSCFKYISNFVEFQCKHNSFCFKIREGDRGREKKINACFYNYLENPIDRRRFGIFIITKKKSFKFMF